MQRSVYMLTTTDIYELPVAVADSVYELAHMTGTPLETVIKGIDRARRGAHSKWLQVVIDDQ